MALPTNECFKGLDLMDQVTAIYEALYNLAEDPSLITPECFKGNNLTEQLTYIYSAILSLITPPESLPTPECFKGLDLSDQLAAMYEALLEIGSGPITPFSPDQIGGLQLWLKDTGIVNVAGEAQEWYDESGNSNNLQIGVGATPLVGVAGLNGFDVVNFFTVDGVGGSPLTFNAPLLSGTSATMFVVMNKSSAWPDSGGWVTDYDFGNNHPFNDLIVRDGSFSNAQKNCGAQVVAIPDNWRIFAIRSQDNAYQMDIDGIVQFSTVTNTFYNGDIFSIGVGLFDLGAITDFALQGSIAEVIVYDQFLTNIQVDQVGGYLATRFGLTWTP